MTIQIRTRAQQAAALATQVAEIESMRKAEDVRLTQEITAAARAALAEAAPLIQRDARSAGYQEAQHQTQRILADFGAYGPALGWARSGGAKWPGGLSSPFGQTVINHWQMRQQARGVYHDTPEAKAMVDRFADTVVDSGLTLDPEPNAEVLGIDQEELENWSRKTAASFDLWAKSKRAHRAGQYNFYQAQRLLQIYSERDNDAFMRYYYSGAADLMNPLQFELIDPNQIRGDEWTSTALLGTMPDGIDRNSDGTEKAYHVWVQTNPGDYTFQEVIVPHIGEKSKRLLMTHGFVSEYAGQGRGYSGLGAVLQEFENLTDFKASEIKKAISQSQIFAFNKPSKDGPSSDPLEALSHQGAGAPPIQIGAPGMGGVSQVGSSTIQPPSMNVTPIMEATLQNPGSLFFANLDSGEELVPFANTAPSVGYREFVDSFCSYLCAMRGMPLEVLLLKFEASYSAARAALLLFWRVACMKRDQLADDFLTPTYEMWLSGEIAAGRISCPGWSDPRIRAAWLSCRWNGSPMPNIDPNATAKADQLYIEMGAQTPDDVARNLNGSSGTMNRAKLKTQFAQLRDAGQVPWAPTGLGSPLMTQIDPDSRDFSKGANGQPLAPPAPPAKQTPGGPNR